MKWIITGGTGNLGVELTKHIDAIPLSSKDWNIKNGWENSSLLPRLHHLKDVVGVIHCAAFTDVPGAEQNPKEAILTNINGTKNVKEFASWQNIKMVYISSDYVYEGLEGQYKETDPARPFNLYGFTKLGGESMLDTREDLIIRTSFKLSKWPYPKAFTDVYSSADYIDIIAEKIAFLIKNYTDSGIINIGSEKKSIYELAKIRNYNVQPMSKNEIKNVKLPEDISMNLEKYTEWRKKYG